MAAMASSDPEVGVRNRLVGWKAIAGYLKVSQRTAIRWADSYGLPVSRVPRGDRPVVYAIQADLDAWWESPAASELRGDDPRNEESNGDLVPPTHVGGFPPVETRDGAAGDARHAGSVSRRLGTLKFLVLAGCVLALAGGIAAWYWHVNPVDVRGPGNASPGSIQRAHGLTAAPALVEMRVTPVGQTGFTITVAEGEMARFDSASLHLALVGKMIGGQLKVFLNRVRPIGTGESVEFLESRLLQPGDAVERVRVAGTELDLMWPGEIPAAVAAARVARSQCCMVCAGLTACGRNVAAPCGACQGELKADGAGLR
jgi:hypothetical protein